MTKQNRQVRAWKEVEQAAMLLPDKYRRSRTYKASYGILDDGFHNNISVTLYGPAKPQQGCVARLHEQFAEFEALLKKHDMNYVENHVEGMYTSAVDPERVSVTLLVVASSEVRAEYRRAREAFNRKHFAYRPKNSNKGGRR